MIHGQTKSNGVHRRRTNGEDTESTSVLLQPDFAGEVHRVMTAVQHGQVHERARLDGATPEERRLLEVFNDGLDSLTTPLAYVLEFLGSLGRGEVPEKITVDFPGELNPLKEQLNHCADLFGLLPETADALKRLEINDHTVAIEENYPGVFGQVGHGVNTVRDRIKSVVRRLQHIAAGEFQEELAEVKSIGKRSEQDILLPAFLDTMQALTSLTDEMRHMAQEHERGDIDVTIDTAKFRGVYQKVAQGINNMVAEHISLKKKAMACVAEFGKGNFDAPLEKFPGKKAFINDTIEQVRTNLKALITDANMLVEAALAGKLATRADAQKHSGDFRKIVEGINAALDALIRPVNVAADYVDKISRGTIPPRITENYNGDCNTIKNNLNACVDALSGLVEVNNVLQGMAVNDCTVRIDKTYPGVFGEMCEAAKLAQLRVSHTVAILQNVAAGDFAKDLKDLTAMSKRSANDQLVPAFLHMMQAVGSLVSDAEMLSAAAVKGKLDTRADAAKHNGDFRKVVEGVNATLDAVIGPLQEVDATLARLAGGDLTAQVTTEYAGDFGKLRASVNTLATQVRSAIQQIGMNSAALVSAAEELNKVSQQMSASAEETATQANVVSAASEQVASNVQTVATGAEEMGASIKEIAKNTAEAARVATTAVKSPKRPTRPSASWARAAPRSARSSRSSRPSPSRPTCWPSTRPSKPPAPARRARASPSSRTKSRNWPRRRPRQPRTSAGRSRRSRPIPRARWRPSGRSATSSTRSTTSRTRSPARSRSRARPPTRSAATWQRRRRAAREITQNITGVAEAARSTTAGANNTQKSAQTLERMAAELQGLVAQFKY